MLNTFLQKEMKYKKVQSIKVFTNDSIGTFSPGLYILYLLKLPAPPRADLSGIFLPLLYLPIPLVDFHDTGR